MNLTVIGAHEKMRPRRAVRRFRLHRGRRRAPAVARAQEARQPSGA
jgi:hypothetical protein